VFEAHDFSNHTGFEHTGTKGNSTQLSGNVCGIWIRASTTKNNPGPTLCEQLTECGHCHDTKVTKTLKDGKQGCTWTDIGWYDRKRDKHIKCASTHWLMNEGKTSAGGSNNIADRTGCNQSPMQCEKTSVSGRWSSSTVDGHLLTTTQYSEMDDYDCVIKPDQPSHSSLISAKAHCNQHDWCGGVRHKKQTKQWSLCGKEKFVTHKLVHNQTRPLSETAGVSHCLAAKGSTVTMGRCTASAELSNCRGEVVLYTGHGFRGKVRAFQPGSYRHKDIIGGGFTKVASLSVPPGCQLHVYSKNNFKGDPTIVWPGKYSDIGVQDMEGSHRFTLTELQVLRSMTSMKLDDLKPHYVPLSLTKNGYGIPDTSRTRLANDEWEQDMATGHFMHSKTKKLLSIAGSVALEGSTEIGVGLKHPIPLCTNSQCKQTQFGAVFVGSLHTSKYDTVSVTQYRQCGSKKANLRGRWGGVWGSSVEVSNHQLAADHCMATQYGTTPQDKVSHDFKPDTYVCKCPVGQCWYPNQGSWCSNKHKVNANSCLEVGLRKPRIANCLGGQNQRFLLQPYRSSWQPRNGFVIYKRGPDPVQKLRLSQAATCNVLGHLKGKLRLQGDMKGRELRVSTALPKEGLEMTSPSAGTHVTGTVNGRETLISWDTEPPTYWTKASALAKRNYMKEAIKLSEKYHSPKMLAKRSCEAHYGEQKCTDILCGELNKLGYVKKYKTFQRGMACGFGKVWPITQSRKGRRIFVQHGWAPELIAHTIPTSAAPKGCTDAFQPKKSHYWKTVTQTHHFDATSDDPCRNYFKAIEWKGKGSKVTYRGSTFWTKSKGTGICEVRPDKTFSSYGSTYSALKDNDEVIQDWLKIYCRKTCGHCKPNTGQRYIHNRNLRKHEGIQKVVTAKKLKKAQETKRKNARKRKKAQEENSKAKAQQSRRRGCFPATAAVRTPMGIRQMSELKVGDCVASKLPDGSIEPCDRIYMFGHAEHKIAPYRVLHLSTGKTISLSANHYIHTARSSSTPFSECTLKHGADVVKGDWLWEVDGMSQVTKTTQGRMVGLYNPYTESGNIIVNDVVASSHSEWFLDTQVSTTLHQYLPAVYQAVLAPNRLLFWATGPKAAESLGLANPAESAEFWITNWVWVATLLAVLCTLPFLSKKLSGS